MLFGCITCAKQFLDKLSFYERIYLEKVKKYSLYMQEPSKLKSSYDRYTQYILQIG